MSPLYGHLPVGAVVYKVGDEMLAAPEGAADRWDTLMSATPVKSQPSLGWCAEEAWFTCKCDVASITHLTSLTLYPAQDTSCCTARRGAVPSLSCFAAFGEARAERCVDPLHFLQPAETQSVLRCASATECGHDQLCIRPRGDQELVTLTMHLPPWMRANEADAERTVVWQGDRSEVAEEGQFSNSGMLVGGEAEGTRSRPWGLAPELRLAADGAPICVGHALLVRTTRNYTSSSAHDHADI